MTDVILGAKIDKFSLAPLANPIARLVPDMQGFAPAFTTGAWPAAGTMILLPFTVTQRQSFNGGYQTITTSANLQHYHYGIYSSSGTLLAYASGSGDAPLFPLTLAAGRYFMAMAVDEVADTLTGIASATPPGDLVPALQFTAALSFSTLASSMLAGDTSLSVTSAATFPAAPFTLTAEFESMRVTLVSGTTFTLTRGIDGTTAAGHAAGVIVHSIPASVTIGSGTTPTLIPLLACSMVI